MSTDIKLLPLPEFPVAVERFILSSLGPTKREGAVTALRTMLREYARSNVAHTTAPLQAEIEALRVEVAAQRARADAMSDEAIKHEARDAARYRQWRDKMISQDHNFTEAMQDSLPDAVGRIRPPTADEWDAAIDATRQCDEEQQ